MPSDPADELIRALSDRRRRQVMAIIDERDVQTVHLDTLVEHLLSREDESTDRDRLRVTLHHQTLPVLAEAGLVEYEGRTHLVRSREDPAMETVLSLVSELESLGERDR